MIQIGSLGWSAPWTIRPHSSRTSKYSAIQHGHGRMTSVNESDFAGCQSERNCCRLQRNFRTVVCFWRLPRHHTGLSACNRYLLRWSRLFVPSVLSTAPRSSSNRGGSRHHGPLRRLGLMGTRTSIWCRPPRIRKSAITSLPVARVGGLGPGGTLSYYDSPGFLSNEWGPRQVPADHSSRVR